MFIVAVYDLTNGAEMARKEFEGFSDAFLSYTRAVRTWRDDGDDALACYHPYDVMLFTGGGNIIYGFGE